MNNQIPQPRYTQFPNALLDNMHRYSDAEWRVACAIARQTFGWHKRTDLLSISQLMSLTGMSKQGVVNGVRSLLQSGVVIRVADGNSYRYGLNIADEENEPSQENVRSNEPEVVNDVDNCQPGRQEIVNDVDRGGQRRRQEIVNDVDTQKKDKKTFKERNKEIDSSSSSSSSSDDPTNDEVYGEIATMAMQSGFYIGQIQAQMLQEMIEEYGPISVKNALAIAAGAGKLNLRYVNGICRRQRNGDEPPRRKGDAVNDSDERNNGQKFIAGFPVYDVELPEPTGEVDF